MLQLTQKETDLLKDMKDQERLCADKYTRHAQCACDPQLKKLFSQLAQQEAQHLQTIHQMESGTVPQMQSSSGQQPAPAFTAAYNDLSLVTVSGRLPDGETTVSAPHTAYTFTDVNGSVHTVALATFDALHDAVIVNGHAAFYLIKDGFQLNLN